MNDDPSQSESDPWGILPSPAPRPATFTPPPTPPSEPTPLDGADRVFGPESSHAIPVTQPLPSDHGATVVPVPPQLPPTTPEPSHRGPNRLLALLTVVLAVGLVGTFVWYQFGVSEEPAPVAAPSVATTLPDIQPEPAIEIQGPNLYDGVADIAELVGPAVVQLDTNFGLGSGVLYDPAGYILTAAHVIDGASTLKVRLADGRLFEGVVVGSHPQTDIAVVKIDGVDLPTAELALGVDTRVGSLAVALGSPFGLSQSVTAGIVSAVDRDIQNVPMVQTDAAINPGNSGGPLVDGAGRVIGINDQIFTNSGGNEGIGFAVSIELAKLVADQLVAGQDVQLSFLGVSSTTSDSVRAGALVQDVQPGSAADAAGLEIGDLIIAIDGDSVTSAADLKVNIINTPPDSEVQIDIIRGDEELTLTATLGRL